MQAKRKLLPILLVLLITASVVAACSGGGAGGREQTWFNLPAVPLDVNPDGTLSLYGIGLPIGAVVPPTLVQQLQAANVQQLQVRAGANGVFIYANGQQLPYIAWDSQSAANLNDVLQAANMAPVDVNQLRTVGLGANLKIPPAQGQPVLNVPRWSGETVIPAAAPAAESTLSLGLTVNDQGQISAFGLPADALAAMSGSALPVIDAGTLAMINTLGWNTLSVQTTPGGITLVANGDQPLPYIAFDAESLQRGIDVATPILGTSNPSLAPLLQQLATMLPNQNLDLTIGFNGTEVATKLSDLPVGIADDGAITFSGMAIPGVTIPAATLAQLTDAGIGSLGVAATDDSILLAVNGQQMPKISFSPAGLDTVANLAGSLAGVQPAMITGGLQALANAELSTSITLPGGEAAPAPTEPTFAAPDLGDVPAPTIKVAATVQDGQITSVGGLTADQLGALGVALPALPANINDTLQSFGAQQVDIVTEPNKLRVVLDGQDTINLEYDQAALLNAWNLLKPQFAGGPLGDPALQGLIEDQFLPLLPGANINLAVTLE
jgi:hypothetical protein